MKRLFTTLIILSIAVSAFGQKIKSGNLRPLVELEKLNIAFDYSDALITGETDESLCNTGRGKGVDWRILKPEVQSRFIEMLFKKLQTVKIGYAIKNAGEYPTLTLFPESIESDGDFRGYAVITDVDGNVICVISDIKASGGHFGSFMNLVGDGMEEAGERLGEFMRDNIKKERRVSR